jgi:hypothetical protein
VQETGNQNDVFTDGEMALVCLDCSFCGAVIVGDGINPGIELDIFP